MSAEDAPEADAKKPRRQALRSRRHPFLRDYPRHTWIPEAVGVVPRYPQTLEAYQRMQAMNRDRWARWRAEGKIIDRAGVPNGWAGRKADLKAAREAATIEAKRIVEYMAANDMLPTEDPRAEEALEACIAIVRARDPERPELFAHGVQARISAAKTVLDFTKQKPATKATVEVARAEDFLAALADKAL